MHNVITLDSELWFSNMVYSPDKTDSFQPVQLLTIQSLFKAKVIIAVNRKYLKLFY